MLIVDNMLAGTYRKEIEKYDNGVIVRVEKNKSVLFAWNNEEEINVNTSMAKGGYEK